MKICNEVKLDFDDILLVPSRSPAASRKDVNVEREKNQSAICLQTAFEQSPRFR